MPSYYPTQAKGPPLSEAVPAPRFSPPYHPQDVTIPVRGRRPRPPQRTRPLPAGGYSPRDIWWQRYMQNWKGKPGYALWYKRAKYLKYAKWLTGRHPAVKALEIAGEIVWDYYFQAPEIQGKPFAAPPGWLHWYSWYESANNPPAMREPPNTIHTIVSAGTLWKPYYAPIQQAVNRTWNNAHNFMLVWRRYPYSTTERMDFHSAYMRDMNKPTTGWPSLSGEPDAPWGRESSTPGHIVPSVRTELPILDAHFQLQPAVSWAPAARPVPISWLPALRPNRPQKPHDSGGNNGTGGTRPDKPGDGTGTRPDSGGSNGTGGTRPDKPGDGTGTRPPVPPRPPRPPLPRPPGPGEKERKAYSNVTKVVADILDKATEIMDAIEVAWDAIDRDCVKRKGGKLNPNDKAKDVYRYASCINIEDFLRGLIANQVEDAIIGRLFALDAAQRAELAKYLGTYPTARRLIDIALEGGLPINIQKIVDDVLKDALNILRGK